MAKKRLDVLLVEKGLVESRQIAQSLIMAGSVLVDEKKIDKPGTAVQEELPIRLLGQGLKYVSRGGLKLEKALAVFPVSVKGLVVADLGASTGGFVDCALQNGAVKVYAVDVGYNQLAWKLRTDERVINMEKTNARYLSVDSLGEYVDVVTTDVAFISLDKILPSAYAILKDDGHLLALIKPQFEAGKDKVGKKGVVRDKNVHIEVIERVLGFARETGFKIGGVDYSPIKGPEGNIEYLLWAGKNIEDQTIDIKKIVDEAHEKAGEK